MILVQKNSDMAVAGLVQLDKGALLVAGRNACHGLALADEIWSVLKYIPYPVHVSELQRQDWTEQRNSVLASAFDVYKRNEALPI